MVQIRPVREFLRATIDVSHRFRWRRYAREVREGKIKPPAKEEVKAAEPEESDTDEEAASDAGHGAHDKAPKGDADDADAHADADADASDAEEDDAH